MEGQITSATPFVPLNASPRQSLIDCGLSAGILRWLWLLAMVWGMTWTSPVYAQPAGDEFSIEPEGKPGIEASVQSEVREILAQPDYRRMRVEERAEYTYHREPFEWPSWLQWPQWLKDFFRWIGRQLEPLGRLFSGLGGLTRGMYVAAVSILVAVLLLIVYLILRVIASYQRGWAAPTATSVRKKVEEGEAGLNPGDVAADVHLAQAAELAARGEFREAIGCLLLGAMSHAEREAWIRYRRGLTYRDYLRAMRGKVNPYDGFKTILGIYEPICFGRREAFREHYDVSLEGYQKGFAGLGGKKK